MKISRNDPGLAHGLAKQMIAEHYAAFEAVVSRDRRSCGRLKDAVTNNPRRNFEMSKAHYGDWLLYVGVKRLRGSRSEWNLLGAIPGENDDLLLYVEQWRKNRQAFVGGIGRISAHVLARLMQRTTGEKDVSKLVDIIGPMLYGFVTTDIAIAEGEQFAICCKHGAILGRLGKFYEFGTWVDASTAADPAIRAGLNRIIVNGRATLPLPSTLGVI